MEQTLILGPPGTGKTTRLLRIMEQEMATGVKPDRIAFVSFTKKASEEAANRAGEKFGFTKTDLPYFRTLHSLAFQQLGLHREEVLQAKNYQELGGVLGLKFSTWSDAEEGLPSTSFTGDRYVFLDGFSRARQITAQAAWQLVADDELNWFEFKRFQETLKEYKTGKGMIDFTDMLENCHTTLGVDVAIIDEAQDLSTLQWDFAYKVLAGAKRIYIAGDDDQGIYQWSGADIGKFLSIKANQIILNQSWRIPSSVHALSTAIASRISERFPKDFHSREGKGLVEYHRDADSIDLTVDGTWLLLARNTYHLKEWTEVVRSAGIPYVYRGKPSVVPAHVKAIRLWEELRKGKCLPIMNIRFLLDYMKQGVDYRADMRVALAKTRKSELDMVELQRDFGLHSSGIWHEALSGISMEDREYYISMLRKGESLTREPRISISTIHGVKGGEADNVGLLSDVTAKTFETINNNPDSEHRVFYVGATRTKNALHVVEPQTRNYYTL